MACPRPSRSPAAGERGAALLETLIAAAIVITISGGAGGLLLWSTRTLWATGTQALAMSLARQKVEQLLSLEWRVDADGTRLSDVTTSVATDPADAGGSGLQSTPGGTLRRNVAGYADFVDGSGRSHPAGSSPPAGAVFVRRWAIVPHPLDPGDTVIITVVVLPLAAATLSGGTGAAGVTLQTARTRTLR
jgi:hypothetical protein